MYKDIYAIKDCPCVTLTNRDNEQLKIDWVNEVHIIRREGYSAVILEAQLTSDNVDDFLNDFTTSSGVINLTFKGKSYDTGNYVVIEKEFINMNFAKEIVSYNCEEVSGFIWVFCDRYSHMRDEVDDYIKIILREPQKSTVNFRLDSISRKLEKANDVSEGLAYALKDIERAILKQSKGIKEETIIASEFVNTLIQKN